MHLMDIRKAENTEKDCNLVFDLSNDPIVRANSFSTERIEYADHVQWYKKMLNDSDVLFFLVFDNADFVGQIRFKRESWQDEKCVISLSISEKFRGKGIAGCFLVLGIQELNKSWHEIKEVTAEVKKGNVASAKLFESAGFRTAEVGENNRDVSIYHSRIICKS